MRGKTGPEKTSCSENKLFFRQELLRDTYISNHYCNKKNLCSENKPFFTASTIQPNQILWSNVWICAFVQDQWQTVLSYLSAPFRLHIMSIPWSRKYPLTVDMSFYLYPDCSTSLSLVISGGGLWARWGTTSFDRRCVKSRDELSKRICAYLAAARPLLFLIQSFVFLEFLYLYYDWGRGGSAKE